MKATNDIYILQMLKDKNYDIRESGEIYTRIAKTGVLFKDINKLRKAGFTNGGYIAIRYKRKILLIHRIIYAKFLAGKNGNPELTETLVINHKNGLKHDNRPENLELVTISENIKHNYRDLNRKPNIGNAKITQKIANKIRKDYQKNKNRKILMLKYKLSKSTVSKILMNKCWIETYAEVKCK